MCRHRCYTSHERKDRIAVVDAGIHHEGVAQKGDHAVGLHLGLCNGSAMGRGATLRLVVKLVNVGVAVGALSAVSGQSPEVAVQRGEVACEIAVGEIRTFGVTADTTDITAAHLTGNATILDVSVGTVRVGGSHNAAIIVVPSRGRAWCAGWRTYNVGVDNHAITDVNIATTTNKPRDGPHHAARFDSGIDHHQRINGTRIFNTSE